MIMYSVVEETTENCIKVFKTEEEALEYINASLTMEGPKYRLKTVEVTILEG